MTLSKYFDASLAPSTLMARRVSQKLSCTLRWRRERLWVSMANGKQAIVLPALASEDWFRICVAKSQAKAVCIDPELGEAAISLWAKACEECCKPTYLRIPSLFRLPQKQHRMTWRIKRMCDVLAAFLLLIVLSPLMLVLAGLVQFQDGGPMFYTQWRVGERGKLFKIYKFRSMIADAEQLHHQVMDRQQDLNRVPNDPRVTPVGKWLRRFSLDELPQLVNVLRGEMSLVGPRPWSLYDMVRVAPQLRCCFNALPGITGQWQVSTRANNLDLYTVNCRDLTYLQQWTLRKDLAILLLTPLKILSRIRAF